MLPVESTSESLGPHLASGNPTGALRREKERSQTIKVWLMLLGGLLCALSLQVTLQ